MAQQTPYLKPPVVKKVENEMTDENDTDIFEDYFDFFSENDFETIKKILSSENFDINRKDSGGFTALNSAVQKDDFALIKFILDLPNVDINAQDEDSGFTALIIAVMNENPEILQYLLERGADVKVTDNGLNTALMLAAEIGSVECLEILLKQKDCDAKATNDFGSNALIQGTEHLEIVKRLIDVSDLSHENIEGANVLHIACGNGPIEVVKMLLEKHSFDLNKSVEGGATCIILAILTKNFEVVEYLFEKGVSLAFEDDDAYVYKFIIENDDSETFFEKHDLPDFLMVGAIATAAQHNRAKTLKKLMNRILASESFDKYEISHLFSHSLQIAASNGNLDCVEILLLFSSDLIIVTLDTLLEALQENHFNCFKYIYDRLPNHVQLDKEELMATAVSAGCVEACKMFLEQGMDPNGSDPQTYLISASLEGYFELVKLLVEHGADINRAHESMGSALFLAAMNNHLEIVEYLLEKGADVTLENEDGLNPLYASVYNGNLEIFNAVYAKDKNINHRTKEGLTIFLSACSSNNLDIVKTLVENGVNVYEIGSDKANCFHYATSDVENLDLLTYLLENIENSDEMLNSSNTGGETPLDFIVENANFSYFESILSVKPNLIEFFDGPEAFKIEENGNNDICVICRDEFAVGEQAVKLPCKHFFHEHCFNEWFNINSICPCCKTFPYAIKLKSVDSIDFEKHARILLKNNHESIKKLVSLENFDINRADGAGNTALHIAAMFDNVKAIKIILEQPNVNINVKNLETGSTPLLTAATSGNLGALKYLIEKGADVSIADNSGFTALMHAVKADSIECIDELLKHKDCNVTAQNCIGTDAFMLGIDNIEMVKRLIDRTNFSHETKSGANAFGYACYSGNLEVVKMILARNVVDVNKPDRNGLTPVLAASGRVNLDVIECLRQHGAIMPPHMTFCEFKTDKDSDESEMKYYHFPPLNTSSPALSSVSVESEAGCCCIS